jgi:hypothetical protein
MRMNEEGQVSTITKASLRVVTKSYYHTQNLSVMVTPSSKSDFQILPGHPAFHLVIPKAQSFSEAYALALSQKPTLIPKLKTQSSPTVVDFFTQGRVKLDQALGWNTLSW